MAQVEVSAVERIVISAEEIALRVAELGREINDHYSHQGAAELTLVTILKGGFIFLADLMRAIEMPLWVDFMSISGYGDGLRESGIVKITQDLRCPVQGRRVLVVEDIIDTGLTLSYILRNLEARHPADIRVCTLLDRKVRRIADLDIDFVGFEVGDIFVAGYGLDFRQRYRNLPYICTLRVEKAAAETF
ncbi:MAG: hypoxanthine phosphoribosyltransferase [Candidatus Geothermincolia bacterium]